MARNEANNPSVATRHLNIRYALKGAFAQRRLGKASPGLLNRYFKK